MRKEQITLVLASLAANALECLLCLCYGDNNNNPTMICMP